MVIDSLARFWNESFNCFPLLSAASRSGVIWGACEAAAVFAGLKLQVARLAVIDLKLGADRQIESERQLHQHDRYVGVAGDADVDQHHQLSGFW